MRTPRSPFAAMVAAVFSCLLFAPSAFAGDPATSIKVNEVESDGVSDFIELANTSGTPTDVSGLILKDNDNARTLAIAGGTSIPAGGFLAVDTDVPGGFALDASDSARVFMPDGVTQIDGFTWTSHAITTFGRCPDGTGPFANTTNVTRGSANCLAPAAWPGGTTVSEVDVADTFGDDLSGLEYEGSGTATPGVLWGVDNTNGTLFRLLFNGANWVPDTANGWTAGKQLRYTNGLGRVDSEGVSMTDAGPSGGVYVSSERNLDAGATRRWSILRYDVSGAGAGLTATDEWDLTANITAGLPAPLPGANLGLESVEWVPDSYLVESGFVDQSTGARYNPVNYPTHGNGIFFTGLEANGVIYAYALQSGGAFTRVATIPTGFTTFAGLNYEPETKRLWAMCDNQCQNRHRVFQVDTSGGPNDGRFVNVADYDNPAGMSDAFNNEGFAITPDTECVAGRKPVFWANDGAGAANNHALRAGTLNCAPAPPPLARSGWSDSSVRADFDADGLADLAVGVRENGSQGAVHIFPGSALGVTGSGSQLWTQNSVGISDVAEDGDEFGAALAVGDYNGDTFPDLAIGAPGENDGAGTVHVLYGSINGLTATGSQQFTQNSTGVGDNVEAGDHFGASLAAGDFDITGSSELVVGVPDEDLGTVADAGIVQVLQGTASGLSGVNSQTWSQNAAGIADNAEARDRFGSSLAVGDVTGSSEPDLAIGVPEEDGTSTVDYGVVHILVSTDTGLTAAGSTLWSQASTGIGDTAESGDGFGASLAIGRLDDSSPGDVVVGVPGEDVGAAANAGVVQTIRGSVAAPTGAGSQTFGQGTPGIADNPETGDEFGYSVAVADLGGSTALDLAVGAPGESGTSTSHYGVVHVIPGGAGGLTATGSQQWSQNSAGVADSAESEDRFGASLGAADYGGTVGPDLAIGVPGESVGTIPAAGIVQVLQGSATFLTGSGSNTLGQNSPGVADNSEAYDLLGVSLGR